MLDAAFNESIVEAIPSGMKCNVYFNVSVQLMSNLIASNNHGTNNLADEMKTLCSQVAQNEFVRQCLLLLDMLHALFFSQMSS